MPRWPLRSKSESTLNKSFTETRRLKFERRERVSWGVLFSVIAIAVAALTIYWLIDAKEKFEASQTATISTIFQTRIEKARKDCRGASECFREILRGSDLQSQFDSQIQNEIANWTFGLLVIAVLGACTSVVGLVWIRASLVAARHANEINSMSIANAERAWVFSDAHADGYLNENHGVRSLEIRVDNKNFGKTAASNVRTNVGAATLDTIDDVMKRLVEDCSAPSKVKDGLLIPPGEVRVREWVWSSDATQGLEVDTSLGPVEFIVGCVCYETMFDSEVHVSGFAYWISVDDWDRITLVPWAGSFAN